MPTRAAAAPPTLPPAPAAAQAAEAPAETPQVNQEPAVAVDRQKATAVPPRAAVPAVGGVVTAFGESPAPAVRGRAALWEAQVALAIALLLACVGTFLGAADRRA
jgi:hypothetical protein